MRRKQEADRLRRESDARALAAGSEADRLKSENDARAAAAKEASDTRLAAAGSEADRLKLENDARTTAAKADSDSRLATADAEADRLKRENASERAASQIELDKVAAQKAQMEKERTELRAQLLNQFNLILQTRDTTRGLIVNMSDVLFDTAKFLTPSAGSREAGGRLPASSPVIQACGWTLKVIPTASAGTTITSCSRSIAVNLSETI